VWRSSVYRRFSHLPTPSSNPSLYQKIGEETRGNERIPIVSLGVWIKVSAEKVRRARFSPYP